MTSKWWPQPSDLRADVARSRLGIPDAEDVLEEILEAVREHGYTKPPNPGSLSCVAMAVVQTMGWRTICDSENPEALRAHALRLAQRFSEKAITAGNLASAGLAEVNLVDSRWWLLAAPCAMIAATLVALNFVGDSLRARFDPAAARSRW
jgi:hypothetical protein